MNEEEPPHLDGMPVQGPNHPEVDEYLSSELTERQLLRERRDAAIEERSKAATWLMTVGFGPAAIIAVLLVLMVDGGANLAWAMAGLGLMMLLLKIYRADRKVREIEEEMKDPMDGS